MVSMGGINYVAVLAAAVIGMMLGMFWHGPLFGKLWLKLQGISQKEAEAMRKKGMAAMTNTMILQFISLLITAFILSYIATGQALGSVMMWVGMIWLGLVSQAQFTQVLWEKRSKELFVFTTVYSLVLLLVMAAVLNIMG